MTTVLSDKIVRCRKEHCCYWCAEKIKKGELAECQTTIYCGDIGSVYLHPECAKANDEAWRLKLLVDGDQYEGEFKRGLLEAK